MVGGGDWDRQRRRLIAEIEDYQDQLYHEVTGLRGVGEGWVKDLPSLDSYCERFCSEKVFDQKNDKFKFAVQIKKLLARGMNAEGTLASLKEKKASPDFKKACEPGWYYRRCHSLYNKAVSWCEGQINVGYALAFTPLDIRRGPVRIPCNPEERFMNNQ
jgi:hypothetical protein